MQRYGTPPSKVECLCATQVRQLLYDTLLVENIFPFGRPSSSCLLSYTHPSAMSPRLYDLWQTDGIPSTGSWNVPSFPSGAPVAFVELEQEIARVKAAQKSQSGAEQASAAKQGLQWPLPDSLQHFPVSADYETALLELGPDVLSLHEAQVAQESSYPDDVAMEAAGGLTNDDIIARMFEMERIEASAPLSSNDAPTDFV